MNCPICAVSVFIGQDRAPRDGYFACGTHIIQGRKCQGVKKPIEHRERVRVLSPAPALPKVMTKAERREALVKLAAGYAADPNMSGPESIVELAGQTLEAIEEALRPLAEDGMRVMAPEELEKQWRCAPLRQMAEELFWKVRAPGLETEIHKLNDYDMVMMALRVASAALSNPRKENGE